LYKIPVRFVFGTCFAIAIYVRPTGHAEVTAQVPEESRVLIVRRLWSLNSDRLETWLIPSGTIQYRQYHDFHRVEPGKAQKEQEKKFLGMISVAVKGGCKL